MGPYQIAAAWSAKAAAATGSSVLTEERPPVAPRAASLSVPDVEPVVPEGRPCPTCNVRNPDSALFCWQCYRPFTQVQMRQQMAMLAGAAAQAGPPIGSPLSPALNAPFDQVPTRRAIPRKKWFMVAAGIVVAILVVSVGKGYWDSLSRTHLQVPAEIGGMQRIDDPQLADAVSNLELIAAKNGATGKAAFYGTAGIPDFFFAAIEYRAGGRTPDDLFSEFAGGFASTGSEAVIDLRTKTSDTHAGADFVCARLKGKPSGSICMWVDRDIVGFVGAFRQSLDEARTLTAVVRTSVED
jgi:hypothetical protein